MLLTYYYIYFLFEVIVLKVIVPFHEEKLYFLFNCPIIEYSVFVTFWVYFSLETYFRCNKQEQATQAGSSALKRS